MTFANQEILAVVDKHILCKQRFAVVGGDTGLKTMVSGFDISVTVVDTDNDFAFIAFRIKITS